MKFVSLSIMFILIVLNFQNCSPSHTGGSGSLNLASIYPYYSEKPDYFESVQLIKVEQGSGGLWLYQFAVSIADADDPQKSIDIEVRIFDQANAVLCPTFNATVTAASNNIVIDNCSSANMATKAKVEIDAKPTTGTTLEPVRTYSFDLSDVGTD